ncbi:unnamed protein product [Phytomonas sp. Hart1]|nr:unnamed protein product [Phytomonas sp. Hart1]|eukprot:CCW65970.1 unnamed protein product [Phytomonas sp. isolate Hart1]
MYRRCIKLRSSIVQAPLFRLPSVLDSRSFTRLVNRQGKYLEKILADQYHHSSPGSHSHAFAQIVKKKAELATAQLRSLKQSEVEDIIYTKYELKSRHLVTCLVPYQYAVNIILSRLPNEMREKCIAELKIQEQNILAKKPMNPNRWIQWEDQDVYKSTGINYLKRISAQIKRRIPIYSIMGHINHGKTTLLDALQHSSIVKYEPHGITQSIRVFTIPHFEANDLYTFIDTPGHKIFAEMRFHSHLIADYIILVVSVIDGIGSQTHEVIKVALNVDKPIVVVINKLDVLSDAIIAESKVQQILLELQVIGIDVDLVHSEHDLEVIHKSFTQQTESVAADGFQKENYFLPMKKVDPTYEGSLSKPKLNLRRRCLGVCISAKKMINMDLLWSLMRRCKEAAPPVCHSNSIGYKEHNSAVQALVVESSKHLFDEEGFRLNKLKQRLQSSLDGNNNKYLKEIERKGPAVRLNMMRNSSFCQASQFNRTSTNVLMLSVIITEGVMTRGMHFIADQAEGCIDYMMDYWGNPIEKALPGMAVSIVDLHSTSSLPGVGIHVFSMINEAERLRIHAYRQLLQWFVECFTTKLHLLRPRGMDVRFIHLGDYGQLKATECLEIQVVYGCFNRTPANTANDALPREKTVAEYLLEVNSIEEAKEVSCTNLLEAKRTNQVVLSKNGADILNAQWQSLQLSQIIYSQEEYERYLHQCIHIGVFVKVDSWHSARMLYREIPRLGTRKILLNVVGIRYGALTVDDVIFFSNTAKIIICFRAPYAPSSDLDHYIEATDQWVLHTDHFADIITFLKWCAVSTHREKVPNDNDMNLVNCFDKNYECGDNTKSQNQSKSPNRSKMLLIPRSDD